MGLFADRHLTSRRREKGKRVGLTLFLGHAENFGRSFLIEIEAKRRFAARNCCGMRAVGLIRSGSVGAPLEMLEKPT